MMRWRKVWVAASLALAGLIVAMSVGSAQASQFKKRTFEEVVDDAETIVVATCTTKKATVRNGNIITMYELKPREVWKGAPRLASNGAINFEELGGDLPNSFPLSQRVSSMANLGEGQELVLFMKPQADRSRALAESGRKPLLSKTTPVIVGGDVGIYTIVKHPETGRELAVRGSLREKQSEAIVNAIETMELKAVRKAVGKSTPADMSADEVVLPLSELRQRVEKRVEKQASEKKD